MTVRDFSRRRWLVITGCVIAAIAFLIGIAFVLINPALTRYFEGPRFRVALEQETAKGLHFPASEFAPIWRTGLLSAESERTRATPQQCQSGSDKYKH